MYFFLICGLPLNLKFYLLSLCVIKSRLLVFCTYCWVPWEQHIYVPSTMGMVNSCAFQPAFQITLSQNLVSSFCVPLCVISLGLEYVAFYFRSFFHVARSGS